MIQLFAVATMLLELAWTYKNIKLWRSIAVHQVERSKLKSAKALKHSFCGLLGFKSELYKGKCGLG